MSISIKLIRTDPSAVLPQANNIGHGYGDTGFDLVAVEDVKIPKGGSSIIPVGLQLADISPGYWMRIEPRSGLGFKKSLQPHLGVIDNGYRGDLAVKMYNFHALTHAVIKKGDKVAQLVVYPLLQPEFAFTDEITQSNRGDSGFGSSDIPRSPQAERVTSKLHLENLTRPPFRTDTKVENTKSVTSVDNSTTVVNFVNEEGELEEELAPELKSIHSVANIEPDINPWEFTEVQSLLDWAKDRRCIVDDDFFSDLLKQTMANRDALKNV